MVSITKETIDAQNAILKINIPPQDYEKLVNESLKKLSKKAEIKGFRKGFVPVGHIKKLYGNDVLAEELNNLINKELTKYLTDNKIEILGSPLPHANGEKQQLDVNERKSYEFVYDLGLNPMIEVTALNPDTKITRYEVKIDDMAVNKEIENVQRKYGEMTNPDDGVIKGDILYVKFIELDEQGNIKEGGVQHSIAVPLSRFEDNIAEQWLGKKPNEYLDVELMKSLKADVEEIIHHYLKLQEHPHLNKIFRIRLEKINRIVPAEVNQQLFDKLFGEGVINTEEEFREKLKGELENYYKAQSEQLLNHDIIDTFLEKTNVPLPDEFLKRWIQYSSDKPVTREQVEHDYGRFAQNLKWMLIANKIKKDNQLNVTDEEMKEHTTRLIRSYYGLEDTEENNRMLGGIADKMLEKEEHVKRTYEELTDKKVLEFIKSKVTLVTKEVSSEEFAKL
ncbi:MAG TPA: trigger factor [Chitinophagales bacterium]|nr:trigger factor [Chitinophagales bacterium]